MIFARDRLGLRKSLGPVRVALYIVSLMLALSLLLARHTLA